MEEEPQRHLTDLVNPNFMFYDGVMQDVRHWDCDITEQIHDMTFNEFASKFATDQDDYRKLAEIYADARNSAFMASYYQQILDLGHGNNDFFVPKDHNMCRVIEVWSKSRNQDTGATTTQLAYYV